MIHQIHSPIDQQLLATVIRLNSAVARENASSEHEILQVSALSVSGGQHLQSHRHRPLARTTTGTAEAWVVVQGSLQVQVFDQDQTAVDSLELAAGDCFVLYRGGHNFTATADPTVFYEIKNGPYYGSLADLEKFK